MFGQHFYNKHISNTVIAFGTVFNNVNIFVVFNIDRAVHFQVW